ncbi:MULTISPECIES: hypothetical protein [unclassified Serratia (in: enterobacteria)]|nr:hypothetical protein [Serratia sp. C2(1)]
MSGTDLGKLPGFHFEVSCGMLQLWFEKKKVMPGGVKVGFWGGNY